MSAHAVPAYSYVHDYISSLGVPARSPRAGMMNAAFAVQGVLLLLGALLLAGASRHTRLFVGLVALNTVGNVVVAAVHSGSPLHGWGALLAIAGGNAAILAGARCVPQLSRRGGIASYSVRRRSRIRRPGVVCCRCLGQDQRAVGRNLGTSQRLLDPALAGAICGVRPAFGRPRRLKAARTG